MADEEKKDLPHAQPQMPRVEVVLPGWWYLCAEDRDEILEFMKSEKARLAAQKKAKATVPTEKKDPPPEEK